MGKLLGNREEDQGLSQCEVMPTQLGHWFLKSLIVPFIVVPKSIKWCLILRVSGDITS